MGSRHRTRRHGGKAIPEGGEDLASVGARVRLPQARNKGGTNMSSLKRWRQVGQGQFQKWETPGQELEGTWQGMHEGRFGALGTLEAAEGRLTFPLPVALRDRLAQVRP